MGLQFNGKDFVKALDAAVAAVENARPARGHLGASGIGARCPRQAWYAYRWAHITQHTGRLHRLFKRGHEEEFRFVEYLRTMGCEVRDYRQRLMYHDGFDAYVNVDWDKPSDDPGYWAECDDVSEDRAHIERATARGGNEAPRQWGFQDIGDHFSGSSDGKVRGPGLPDGWGLTEFKTHSDKSFQGLVSKGVASSKPVHYVQMQIYMHYLGLPWALYLAVNKNNDELHAEVIPAKPEVAQFYIERAGLIVNARAAPDRITQDPSWWECKFCDFREICHYQMTPQKNCRSCIHASPETGVGGAEWVCTKYHQMIPKDFAPKGCDAWEPIE